MPDEKSVDFDQPLTEEQKDVTLSPDDKALLHEMDDDKHGPEFYDKPPVHGKERSAEVDTRGTHTP